MFSRATLRNAVDQGDFSFSFWNRFASAEATSNAWKSEPYFSTSVAPNRSLASSGVIFSARATCSTRRIARPSFFHCCVFSRRWWSLIRLRERSIWLFAGSTRRTRATIFCPSRMWSRMYLTHPVATSERWMNASRSAYSSSLTNAPKLRIEVTVPTTRSPSSGYSARRGIRVRVPRLGRDRANEFPAQLGLTAGRRREGRTADAAVHDRRRSAEDRLFRGAVGTLDDPEGRRSPHRSAHPSGAPRARGCSLASWRAGRCTCTSCNDTSGSPGGPPSLGPPAWVGENPHTRRSRDGTGVAPTSFRRRGASWPSPLRAPCAPCTSGNTWTRPLDSASGAREPAILYRVWGASDGGNGNSRGPANRGATAGRNRCTDRSVSGGVPRASRPKAYVAKPARRPHSRGRLWRTDLRSKLSRRCSRTPRSGAFPRPSSCRST